MQDFIKGSNGYIYVKVQELMGEIETYKFGNTALDEEIKILFPEITSVSLGTVSNYSKPDSVGLQKLLLYTADKPIDEDKMKTWMQKKL